MKRTLLLITLLVSTTFGSVEVLANTAPPLTCEDVAFDYALRIYDQTGDTSLSRRAFSAALRLCNAYN